MLAIRRIPWPCLLVALNGALAWVLLMHQSLGCVQWEWERSDDVPLPPGAEDPRFAHRAACAGGEVLMTLVVTLKHKIVIPLVLESLEMQTAAANVSCLVLVLNGFRRVPHYWESKPGRVYHLPGTNLGANGHFFDLEFIHRFKYHMGVADHVVYPSDYVAQMTAKVDKYGGENLVGVHCRNNTALWGLNWMPLLPRYPTIVAALDRNYRGGFVDYISHGTFAYDTRHLQLTREDFPLPAVTASQTERGLLEAAQKSGMQTYCIERKWLWLKPISEQASRQ
eukprot:TRINITY_DN15386_c0_g1_i2.p1 TRINITY_DN15386_c0_g1~~TRINITY_DN15386_c0_g1_i2.p1  ORF type:complete len:281 (-),score=24.60 TRINITY_DN15386_c0_g1_i2:244-1086(-)